MKNKKKKKKIKVSKKSLLLDTSIFVERCKYPEIKDFLEKKKSKGYELVSSFFVLYEFKTGFIKSLIDFYSMIGSYQSISRALARCSDKFGRMPKYGLIYTSMVFNIQKSIDTEDIEGFLFQLEAIIFNQVNNFSTMLSSMVGGFQDDEVVKFRLKTRDDFLDFADFCNNRKIIPLDKFWEKNNASLKKLIDDKDIAKKYKTMHKYLKKIKDDKWAVNKPQCNRGIGDAVIATDCSVKRTILSKDGSFEFLCGALGKKAEIIKEADYII